MPRALYSSVVSKIAIRVPMFAKAIVDQALAKVGANPYTVTPGQMKHAIEAHITPIIDRFLKPEERVRHLGSGLLAVDAGGHLVQCSPAARGMLELRGKAAADDDVVRLAEQLGVLAPMREVVANGEEVLIREIKLPSGRVLNVAIGLVRSASGAPTGLFSLMQDVTLSAQLEGEVDRLFLELEMKNESLRRSQERLRFYVSELEQATRLKSRLLANVSHELRTPLNAIIGFTDAVLHGMDGPITTPQRETLDLVAGSSRHLLSLINDLLDLSSLEAGKVEIHAAPVDVTELVSEVISTLAILASAKGIRLAADVALDIAPVLTDETRLRQILLNLVSNGIKYTQVGSVRIEVRAGTDRVIVRVIDTGIGIPAPQLTDIWQEFHRLAPSSPQAPGGSGLGLSISRRYAELLGGTLDVESAVGRGTTFTLVLPRAIPVRAQPRVS